MEVVLIVALGILIFLVTVLFFRLEGLKNNNQALLLQQQLQNVHQQLQDMSRAQLEGQRKFVENQQKTFIETQKVLQDQLKSILETVNKQLSATQSTINEQLQSTHKTVQTVHQKLGTLEEATRKMEEIGKDISSLQDILKAPKLRGNLGEFFLEDLLRQVLASEFYQMQYQFKDGTKVDAVIKLGGQLVPIDSKFPMESFQRYISAEDQGEKKKAQKEFLTSLKKRIDEIAQKYIKPSEGTFEFALMYIPAENIYYEMLTSQELSTSGHTILNYALENHVVAVSPNSFYAYLMAIVFGLKGFKIEQAAQKLRSDLSSLQKDYNLFMNDFNIVGKHIENASRKFNESFNKGKKFQIKLETISNIHRQLESGKSQN